MKHFFRLWPVYRLLLVFCFASTCSWGQTGPFHGANTVLLSTTLADRDAYKAIMAVLSAEHISFTAEKQLLLMRSEVNSPQANRRLTFEGQLTVNTGLVKLTGQLVDVLTQQPSKAMPISYTKGSASSRQRVGFLYMDELARKLQTALQGSLMYKYQQDPI